MFQGFYGLTSGVLTQTRNLNVISNNMANMSTPGFKRDQFVGRSFQEELLYRSGNKVKAGAMPIGNSHRIVAADRNYTDFTQAAFQPTSNVLDFALSSPGFFSIQSGNQTVYTRNGSFSLDAQGYLNLQGVGRVMGTNGPLYAGTDKITVDRMGNVYTTDDNRFLGRLAIVDFDDYDAQLTKTTGDVYIANAAGRPVNGDVVQYAVEASNADPIKEMTSMMSGQKALQSSAQVLRIYDQLMGKIVSQLGPV